MEICCIKASNTICKVLSYLFCPLYYPLKYLLNEFQRPYSFCMIMSFFILMIPGIFLLIITIHFYNEIKSQKILSICIINLFLLGTNYFFSIIIYDLYQQHSRIKTIGHLTQYNLSKRIKKFFMKNTILISYIIILLADIVFGVFSIVKVSENMRISIKIINDAIFLGALINLIYAGLTFIIYSFLILFLFCSVANGCCCSLFEDKEDANLNFDLTSLNYYLIALFKLYKFFGLFDYKKFFSHNLISKENGTSSSKRSDETKEDKVG